MGNRKTNFEIKSVPKKVAETKEDLIKMAMFLSETIGGSLKEGDIKEIYRVRVKKEGSPNTPIIEETISTFCRNGILKMAKVLNSKHKSKLCASHLGLKLNEDSPIFVSEQLTSKGSRLHFLARDLVKSKKFKYLLLDGLWKSLCQERR